MKDMYDKKIDCIIVKDLSRFGRNYIEVGRYIDYIFPSMGIRFISINDNIDNVKNPESLNSVIVPLKNLMNDEYCRDIARKVKKVKEVQRLNGEITSGSALYGYLLKDKNYVIDLEVKYIITMIFEMCIAGESSTKIAYKLNEEKIDCPKEHFCKRNNVEHSKKYYWDSTKISNILKNEVYCGTLVQGKTTTLNNKVRVSVPVPKEDWIRVENTHEALVSKEDFKWIQENYYTKIIQIRRKNHDYALFSGFLICNDCHRGLYYLESRRPRKDGSRLKYYICGTNKVNSKGCTPHRIKEDDLIEIVRKSINKQIKLVTKLNDDLELISKNKKLSIKGDILLERKNTLSESINQKMKLKQSLYTDWKEEIITFEDYKNYSSSYNNEILEIRETIKIIDKELEELDNIPNYQVDLIKLFNNRELFKKIDRDILFKFIECIYIFEDKRVEIVFKYQDIYQNLLEYVKKNKSYLKPA